ncbi:MAG: hypothetical protein R3A45_12915 [Bdellovibrionota bacterium]
MTNSIRAFPENEVDVFLIGPVDQVQLTDSDTRVHTFALIDQSHETDQLGNPRPTGTGGACDFGAVEETSITGMDRLPAGDVESLSNTHWYKPNDKV